MQLRHASLKTNRVFRDAQYKDKLNTADYWAKQVKNGDYIEDPSFGIVPWDLDEDLAKRKKELKRVYIRGCTMLFRPKTWEEDKEAEVFLWLDHSYTALTRKTKSEGEFRASPMLLHEMPFYYEHPGIKLNYYHLAVGPMDKNDCFNLGPSVTWVSDAIRERHTGAQNMKIIVEVNPRLPYCRGDTVLHISEADGICETTNPRPPIAIGAIEASETEKKIVCNILKIMPKNACLQFGIGGLPNLIGKLLRDSDAKDLGVPHGNVHRVLRGPF